MRRVRLLSKVMQMHWPNIRGGARACGGVWDARLLSSLERLSASDDQRRALLAGLDIGRFGKAAAPDFVMAAHLPLLIVQHFRPGDVLGYAVAVPAILFETGVDLLDDIVDGDLPEEFAGGNPGLALLIATGYLGSAPYAAMADIPVPAAVHRLIVRRITGKWATVAAGEQRRLELIREHETDAEMAFDATTLSSGHRTALYCMLAALALNLSGTAQAALERGGRALGLARVLSNDLQELLHDKDCRDIRRGCAHWIHGVLPAARGEATTLRRGLLEHRSVTIEDAAKFRQVLLENGIEGVVLSRVGALLNQAEDEFGGVFGQSVANDILTSYLEGYPRHRQIF